VVYDEKIGIYFKSQSVVYHALDELLSDVFHLEIFVRGQVGRYVGEELG